MGFERVARLSDITEDAPLGVRVSEVRIGLYQTGGRLYAMEDDCPHAGLPLHEGTVDETRVICAGHGWEFDLETGLAPGEQAEEPLTRYPVRIEGDDVYVDVTAPITRGHALGTPVAAARPRSV